MSLTTTARLFLSIPSNIKYISIYIYIYSGLWPAFWTLGNNFFEATWPSAGELDIMEMGQGAAIAQGLGNRRVVSGAHWEFEDTYATYAGYKDFATDLSGEYQMFVMDWTPDTITTYVNDTEVWKMDIDSTSCVDCEEFHRPHFLVLNMAIGGGFTSGTSSSSSGSSGSCGTSSHGSECGALRTPEDITAPLPATMYIDWVRIYDNGFSTLTQYPPAPAGVPSSGSGSAPVVAPAPVPAAVVAPAPVPAAVVAPVPKPAAVVAPVPKPAAVVAPATAPDVVPAPVAAPAGGAPQAGSGVAPVAAPTGGAPQSGSGGESTTCCWLCNDGGVSMIQNPGAVVALTGELATLAGASSATCLSLQQMAEVDHKLTADQCFLLDVEMIRIACGCPNELPPASAPSTGGVSGPSTPSSGGVSGPSSSGGASGPSSPVMATPSSGGVSGPSSSGGGSGPSSGGGSGSSSSSAKGPSTGGVSGGAGSGSGKSGKSSKSSKSKKGKSGSSSGVGTEEEFFAASSSRRKGRSRRNVVGATITAYGLAQLL